jgi:outer membrane lipoprotein carrier protein
LKLIILLICLISSIFASPLKIDTFEANFTQTIINTSGKTIQYDGYIAIQEPFKMLWKYETPIKKDVHISQFLVVIVEPELEQAIFSSLNQEVNILNLLSNVTKISKTKYQTKIHDIVYTLTIEKNILKKINYTDNIENKITINFTNIKQNQPLDKNIFKFHIPREYDIIRNN